VARGSNSFLPIFIYLCGNFSLSRIPLTSSVKPPLTLATAALLVVPPLLWAANSVVGRLVSEWVPPLTLNALRWVFAFIFLLPFTYKLLGVKSLLWVHWRRYALLGLLGVGSYNSLQYLALHTSSPINVTLVGSIAPVVMLTLGVLFFGQKLRLRQCLGALLSVAGVLLVLCRGNLDQVFNLHWVIGDIYVLIAVLAWSWYSWLLSGTQADPPEIRGDWRYFLMAQIVMGLGWSSLFTTAEWTLTPAHIEPSWYLFAALLFVSLGPAIAAYRCWGLGIQRVGTNIAGFFANLTPLFAALMSSVLLGDLPELYHAVAFVLIVAGILAAS
jgi:drug/metabolite transporter (DMT)-like permease